MGDTIFTDIFTTVIVTINYVRLINYFKIQISHAIAGKGGWGGGGGPGKKIPLQKKKKDRLIAGKGKNE